MCTKRFVLAENLNTKTNYYYYYHYFLQFFKVLSAFMKLNSYKRFRARYIMEWLKPKKDNDNDFFIDFGNIEGYVPKIRC